MKIPKGWVPDTVERLQKSHRLIVGHSAVRTETKKLGEYMNMDKN